MIINQGDFVELKYSGRTGGQLFDTNDPVHVKESDRSKVKKLVIIVGQGFVVPGLDKALVGKEVGKKYEIHVMPNEAFGARNASLMKTFPIRVFHDQKINPLPGMTLMLDNTPVLIRSVSGARVTADFNNPLAGKEIDYEFEIVSKVEDPKEKTEAFFQGYMRFVPAFEVESNKVILKGSKPFENIVEIAKKRFKELIGLDLEFKLEEPKAVEKKTAPTSDLATQQSL